MIIIPGQLIALCTFPGVAVHEISHRLACDLLDVPVFQARYFIPGSLQAGHVIHEKTKSISKSFLIGFAPLLINSLLCMTLTFPVSMAFYVTSDFEFTYFNALPFWIGISCGANAFPSNQDIDCVLTTIKKNQQRKLLLRLACYSLKFCNILSRAFFNFIYAWALALAIPYLLL